MKIYDAFDEPYETHVKKLLFQKMSKYQTGLRINSAKII